MTTTQTTQQQKDSKPTNGAVAKPAAPASTTSTAAAAQAAVPEKEKRTQRKVFIVTGQVHEFKNTAEAEKFLNGGGSETPQGEFTVIKGTAVEKKQKVSLR